MQNIFFGLKFTKGKQMPKLKFIIDKNYDGQMIYQILRSQRNIKDIKYQAEVLGINFEFAKKVSSAPDFDAVRKEIMKLVNDRYKKNVHGLEKAKKEYQASWDEINDEFFERLKEITNFPIQHKQFECVVSAFHPGISNWGGNKIARIWNIDPLKQRRITAHEIIISHFFSLIRNKYPKVKSNKKIWQLAEIFAFAVTLHDKVLTRFWPWDKTISYTEHNYPELVSLQKKLTPVYLRRGLDEFIQWT